MKTIVFAYSQLGYICLKYLIETGEDIQAVFTHEDNPHEFIWFDSVAELAKSYGIPVLNPPHPNTPLWVQYIKNLDPDIIFSFYYRRMICKEILDIPRLGALNMHGSLLPQYRGRVPINWAIIRGELETGVTLHYMVKKPDAGDIIDQESVAILQNDTAGHVMEKVIEAAYLVLKRQIPFIKIGHNPRISQDHTKATYFGGRKWEDGLIDWSTSVQDIHNLIRALLPYPQYPCAYFIHGNDQIRVIASHILQDSTPEISGSILKISNEEMVFACGKQGKERIRIRSLI